MVGEWYLTTPSVGWKKEYRAQTWAGSWRMCRIGVGRIERDKVFQIRYDKILVLESEAVWSLEKTSEP